MYKLKHFIIHTVFVLEGFYCIPRLSGLDLLGCDNSFLSRNKIWTGYSVDGNQMRVLNEYGLSSEIVRLCF